MAGERPYNAPTSDERTLAVLSHLLTVIPGVGIIAPLVIYIVKNKESEFVAHHARESLNFQITIILLYVISVFLMLVAIGVLLVWIVGIVNTVLAIVATIRASEGQLYRYPFNLRLIS